MPRVAIIGTAGRKEDARRMTADLYYRMVHDANKRICEMYDPSEVILVSGGAAWADHVAVSLWLSDWGFKALHLHFPAPFVNSRFQARGERSAGAISNFYHYVFGMKMKRDRKVTLRGIQRAIDEGAVTTVSRGFYARNRLVGDVDAVLAYTWGESYDHPKDGGTRHTWDHSGAPVKIHVPLSSL